MIMDAQRHSFDIRNVLTNSSDRGDRVRHLHIDKQEIGPKATAGDKRFARVLGHAHNLE